MNRLNDHDAKVARVALTALALGKRIGVEYDGLNRIVEVHAVGVSTAGKACMRVFQVEGGTVSGESQGWKMLSLGKINTLPKVLDSDSLAPRKGYNKGDLGMSFIFREL